ncbi:bacteriophage protein [Longimycelium tulufanense]|uniref:Bacteriophage protein n=1 Tax=Longimycelium tulufanense TaxID=907463 RepID=A0A8J3FV65_9PSEU|nr:hypothetical protein [Longimycelium tulufanense]GGM55620.1 bacteriophage protein [Longimycelium tulufanense]
MGNLADRLSQPTQPDAKRPRASAPKGFEPGVRYDATGPVEVTVQLDEIPEDEQHWRDEIQRVVPNLTIPSDKRVVLTQVRFWGDPGSPSVYCRFAIEDRDSGTSATLDVNDIVKVVKATRRKQTPRAAGTGRALVVAYADLQVGKVGSRGGSEKLVDRILAKLDALDEYTKQNPCDSAYLIDCGDCVESFENTPQQSFTNDLSFPEQLRLARRLFTEAATRLAARHSRVVCAGVPSNHGQWRRGKDRLGRPGDDYGLETLTAVADAFSLNPDVFGHVSFVVPDMWQETIALDVHGTILAVTHGHQVTRPERIPQWWAGQALGGQPAADADLLLTGHFHHLRVQPVGRSQHTGRSRWWIQAPTIDNGSDWYRLNRGEDSDPGLLVFTVDESGWDGLKVL